MAKILLLEDDAILGESLADELDESGYEVTWVKDADTASEEAFDNRFALYLFDVNVPGMSGFELLRSLRDAGDETPTLFLTARTSIEDLEKGFAVGADDYITKPFEFKVLLIRIKAKIKIQDILHVSRECTLHVSTQSIHKEGKSKTLARKEFDILRYFIEHKERIISKEDILDTLYESEFISDSTFRVYIKNINKDLAGCAKLSNVRGVGYKFELL